jgi:hypothetical protein
VLPVDHRDRAEETLATDVFFTQLAKTDPSLADMPPFAVLDPGSHDTALLSGVPPHGLARAPALAGVAQGLKSRRMHSAPLSMEVSRTGAHARQGRGADPHSIKGSRIRTTPGPKICADMRSKWVMQRDDCRKARIHLKWWGTGNV